MNTQELRVALMHKKQVEATNRITAWYDTRLHALLELDAETRQTMQRMTTAEVGGKTLVLMAEVLQSIESDIKETQKTYDDYIAVAKGKRDSFDFIPSLRYLLNDLEDGDRV